MSGTSTKMLQAAAGAGGEALAIEDVFSTYLYTGNGSTQTITNGIDLAGEGGLVWIKDRGQAINNVLQNTENGAGFYHYSDSTNAMNTTYQSGAVSSFNVDGFSVGNFNGWNQNGQPHTSWTFRKAPRFFDVVTYTGDGTSSQVINHNLDSTPGCIMVKTTNSTENWVVYHRGRGRTRFLRLNDKISEITDATAFPANPNSTTFTVGSNGAVNTNGNTYVAYVFAHNAGGFGPDEDQSVISCGFYTGSTSDVTVTLGWEPQWVLIKSATSSTDWILFDNMRGVVAKGINDDKWLEPNTSNAEAGGADGISFDPTGFTVGGFGDVGSSGQNYIYIAIRRGPMRQPESGTEVFAMDYSGSVESQSTSTKTQYYSGFPVDWMFQKYSNTTADYRFRTRLAGNTYLSSTSTSAESSEAIDAFGANTGVRVFTTASPATTLKAWMFRRAPGFFDVVAYTGSGNTTQTKNHSLGVAPEMMWVKRRDSLAQWGVYHKDIGFLDTLVLDSSAAQQSASAYWKATPTDTEFYVGTGLGTSGGTYIAYLFATLPGISKVGSYTGNGTSQTIDCGFTSGARFILIKRTDSTGDWYVWDTERGIVAANDPHLSLNTTAAEVTTDDSVDPDSSGFIVNQVAATNINVLSAEYIFYAIS